MDFPALSLPLMGIDLSCGICVLCLLAFHSQCRKSRCVTPGPGMPEAPAVSPCWDDLFNSSWHICITSVVLSMAGYGEAPQVVPEDWEAKLIHMFLRRLGTGQLVALMQAS
jgi:hypothetical protein